VLRRVFLCTIIVRISSSYSGAAGLCELPRDCSRMFSVVHSALLFKVLFVYLFPFLFPCKILLESRQTALGASEDLKPHQYCSSRIRITSAWEVLNFYVCL